MAYLNKNNRLKGLRRIQVRFYRKNPENRGSRPLSGPDAVDYSKPVATTLSESDGYLYYMGLEPGEYVARIAPEQLKNLNMTATPGLIPFKINRTVDGDIVRGLDFILNPVAENLTDTVKPKQPVE